MCLGGCSQRGECWEGSCFCDPGWAGDDCAREVTCEGGCSGHGTCAYGLCYCDPGWEGPDCEVLVPCPGQCSGHGECLGARCFCAPGWRGAACEEAAPEANSGCHVSLPQAILAQVPFAILGLGVGWGIRFAAAERQRAKMREILQEDAQRPFASQ